MTGATNNPPPAPITTQTTVVGATAQGQCANCGDCQEEKGCCLKCLDDGHGNGLFGGFRDMPQSCYNPAYGCYPGNDRRINRYPAFHGSYYRKPYNYRETFDYPWHAGLHEPTSLFSYNVINPEEQERNINPMVRPTAAAPTTAEKPKVADRRGN